MIRLSLLALAFVAACASPSSIEERTEQQSRWGMYFVMTDDSYDRVHPDHTSDGLARVAWKRNVGDGPHRPVPAALTVPAITVTWEDKPLEEALAALAEIIHVPITLDPEAAEGLEDARVSLAVRAVSALDVLPAILRCFTVRGTSMPLDFRYEIRRRGIVILRYPPRRGLDVEYGIMSDFRRWKSACLSVDPARG